MVLPEPYFSLSDSRDTSCAIRFFSEPVPQLRDIVVEITHGVTANRDKIGNVGNTASSSTWMLLKLAHQLTENNILKNKNEEFATHFVVLDFLFCHIGYKTIIVGSLLMLF